MNSWGTRLIWPGPLGTCGSGATSNRGSQTVLSVSDDMAPLHDQHASLFTPLFCSLHGVTTQFKKGFTFLLFLLNCGNILLHNSLLFFFQLPLSFFLFSPFFFKSLSFDEK